jgi:indolepyruvate ferredoxin oxidoreductase alpha subunit
MSKNQQVMTGNQAIARGFYEVGGKIAASYPGSPTVEIVQTIHDDYKDIYSEFSVNEKVAFEVAIGGSFAGARSLVSMKHVGVNIAADPLMTFTETPTQGGFLLVSGDDPGMASSQNEQDNRYFARFAHMPVLDPSTSQEAKDFTAKGILLSEAYHTPVMLRITSRLCHSRGIVDTREAVTHTINGFDGPLEDFNMIPPYTFEKQYHMVERLEKIQRDAETLGFDRFEERGSDILIVTSGICYVNLMELEPIFDVYKLGMVHPLPIVKLQELASRYKRVIVIEEMLPFIEEALKLAGIPCEGKSYFSFTGELHTETIAEGLVLAGLMAPTENKLIQAKKTVERLPMFCAGCPHRPVFDILKKTKAKVIGDIGCYSLTVLPPLKAVRSIISMGASIGIMKGVMKANQFAGIKEPLVAVIGDGTFYHSGMTGVLNLLHQVKPDENMTVLILNNGTTAMTGGQPSAGSGFYSPDADLKVDMVALLRSMGFDRIQVVDQFDYKKAKDIINEEIKYEGLSIVITTRPCALNFKIVEPHFVVDPKICINCRSCLKTNCPPILMKAYEGIDKLKSSIDPHYCVGCSVCSQVCPVGAIKRSSKEV